MLKVGDRVVCLWRGAGLFGTIYNIDDKFPFNTRQMAIVYIDSAKRISKFYTQYIRKIVILCA